MISSGMEACAAQSLFQHSHKFVWSSAVKFAISPGCFRSFRMTRISEISFKLLKIKKNYSLCWSEGTFPWKLNIYLKGLAVDIRIEKFPDIWRTAPRKRNNFYVLSRFLTLRRLMSYIYIYDIISLKVNNLTLILLTWRKWWAPNNASK